MAGVSQTRFPDDVGGVLTFDDDCDATPTENIDNGATTIKSLTINSAHGAITYLHCWDKASNVTVGTDAMDYTFPIASNGDQFITVISGGSITNGFSFACTTDRGTAANTSPATPTDVYVVSVPS